jgi:EAL domain-containing protein (putative c-di-GMP-specific phosphodiesterase class I)
VDDFGVGYSSLSYLTMFSFNKIKIDKSFTQNMIHRADCAAIIAAVVALGSSLGIKTVAEGVESEEHYELLRIAGVDFLQGYLFGRACAESELNFERFDDQLVVSAA